MSHDKTKEDIRFMLRCIGSLAIFLFIVFIFIMLLVNVSGYNRLKDSVCIMYNTGLNEEESFIYAMDHYEKFSGKLNCPIIFPNID